MTDPSFPRRKYSKSFDFYLQAKSDFFTENDDLLQKSREQAELYTSQPRRAACKLCNQPLAAQADFSSHGIDYGICAVCGHLNGLFDDTSAFVDALYISDAGREYSKNYIDSNFPLRAEKIYLPKLEFLTSSLPSLSDPKILDIGCGAGYFVYSALSRRLAVEGIDVGRDLIEFGNAQIEHQFGCRPLRPVSELEFFDAVSETDADVISAIGVIEHLRQPQSFFDAFQKCRAKYLFLSVPMFSLSAYLENIFKDVFPRQLSGGHTHLFSEESLAWLYADRNLVPVAEWRFGTDIMDLFRSTKVTLKRNGVSARAEALFDAAFAKNIDPLQSILDQSHFCSEIHALVAKKQPG